MAPVPTLGPDVMGDVLCALGLGDLGVCGFGLVNCSEHSISVLRRFATEGFLSQ